MGIMAVLGTGTIISDRLKRFVKVIRRMGGEVRTEVVVDSSWELMESVFDSCWSLAYSHRVFS
jgi:hypothetical protein